MSSRVWRLPFFLSFTFAFITSLQATAAVKPTAPDANQPGPLTVESAEYKLPAKVDPEVLAGHETEIWAKLYHPADFTKGPYPLVIFLHGNHGTCGFGSHPRSDDSCEYTETGKCPQGWVVTPNHEGYSYLANNLASWGYVVVSINANRGITCGDGNNEDWGLNLARGRLILKHLSLLSDWNSKGGAPLSLGIGADGLRDKLDFLRVGLMGHSRGGEGARAAYNLYRDPSSPWPQRIPDLNIKAIFEIGAVDGQTSRVLDAPGVAWNQLLPMCDGDVYDLQGRYPFERMLLSKNEDVKAQKSTYMVWGANHNFFNTEWQGSDSESCYGHTPIFDPDGSSSESQQKVALASVPGFFRAWLSPQTNEENLNLNFNPLAGLPASLQQITPVEKDFVVTPNGAEDLVLEDFDQGTGTSSSGFPTKAVGVFNENRLLDPQRPQRVSTFEWTLGAGPVQYYFESTWAAAGSGKDLKDFSSLDLRVSRMDDTRNLTTTPTDFSIQLVAADGSLSSAQKLSAAVSLLGPVNGAVVLQTARLSLKEFTGIDLAKVRGVRLVFDQSPSGAIYIANIRVSKNKGLGYPAGNDVMMKEASLAEVMINSVRPRPRASLVESVTQGNEVVSIVRVKEGRQIQGAALEMTLRSLKAFPVRNALPELHIGDLVFKVSRYKSSSNLKELVFSIDGKSEALLRSGADIRVQYGSKAPFHWNFGKFHRDMIAESL